MLGQGIGHDVARFADSHDRDPARERDAKLVQVESVDCRLFAEYEEKYMRSTYVSGQRVVVASWVVAIRVVMGPDRPVGRQICRQDTFRGEDIVVLV